MIDMELTQIDGGWRVKETPNHYIDIVQMAYSWRLCETPKSCELVYDRYWYAGRGPRAFEVAASAALARDGSPDTEPAG